MIFAAIPAGDSIIIDANTLVYHFTPHPVLGVACAELFDRVKKRDVFASTSTHVLSDVAHRIMTTEAIAKFGRPVAGIAQRLRRHPAEIKLLSLSRQAMDQVKLFGIRVIVPAESIISSATIVSQQHGLLSGDALIVAMMQDFGFSSLASHDADFDRVPWITRYGPV